MTFTISFPFGWLIILAVCTSVSAAIGLYTSRYRKGDQTKQRLSLRALTVFGFGLLPTWASLFGFVLFLLWKLSSDIPELSDFGTNSQTAQTALHEALRWHILAFVGLLTALGGLITLPIALIRVMTTERQVTATEQNLITDRINKAVEGLGADKVVKRQRVISKGKKVYSKNEDGTPDLTRPIWDEVTEPNLEVRIGAIFSLERISQDSPRDHIQIMEILCAYIVQNSDRSHTEMPANNALSKQAWQAWQVKHLQRPRADIDVAVRVLSRRAESSKKLEEASGYQLDLQSVDLRFLEIAGLRLENANLKKANLEGAQLSNASFDGASLAGAKMSGGILKEASFIEADLRHAELVLTDLQFAKFTGADLKFANLQTAWLEYARLQSVQLFQTQLQGAFLGTCSLSTETPLSAARLRGALLYNLNLENVPFYSSEAEETFGNEDVVLADHVSRPKHWRPTNAGSIRFRELLNQWRGWQKTIGFDPEDSSTWYTPNTDRS